MSVCRTQVDEEALYGAVIRDVPPGAAGAGGPGGPGGFNASSQQPPRGPGGQGPGRGPGRGPSQQSAADRAVAWGRAGSGVAAVAGGLSVAHQKQQQAGAAAGVEGGLRRSDVVCCDELGAGADP